MTYDLFAVGELLVDMLAAQQGSLSTTEEILFSRAAGGAPANVAAGAARLLGPGRAGFIGRVGDDAFGRFLKATLNDFGVDTTFLTLAPDVQTPLAIAGRAAASEEVEFTFYGPDNGGRLALATLEDLPEEKLAEASVVVMGGVSLAHPLSRAVTLRAAQVASEGSALVAFDPNWRPILWQGPEGWIESVRAVLPFTDVLKVSRMELTLLSAGDNREVALDKLALIAASDRAPGKPLLIALTIGAEGALYSLYPDPAAPEGARRGVVPPITVQVVDPTGAGDAFLAGLLCGILRATSSIPRDGRLDLASLAPEQLDGALLMGNATGAMTTTRNGAMAALPTLEAVQSLLARTAT